ncbi:UDP-3-O-(3-hydroxymyristoyl)glucosamine N-acyltransferase [Leeia aquatica]|uniref:UDP-3-O-acylglucosamine N-acyltransferase n=1 Tax=Leeia aquatica TaxID=2725557 RepID=A0A847SC17_9NEIS|nr:UDP-3-O-(3-hydroxymyristoyl)glucosamine N-acyltransferase [Leeia aquatica]NLR74668.1 UDP-3-O-(3-hydroxymyristoyl)glucosamine N-acyltransferase [Leeia aquatica]
MRLSQLVSLLGGCLQGEDVDVIQVAPLELAGAGQISFLANRKYARQLATTQATAVILPADLAAGHAGHCIVADNPYLYFARVSQLLNPVPPIRPGIHPSAVVEVGAVVDPSAEVGALAYIGANAMVGAHALIGPQCYVGEGASIGAHTRLMARVVIQHGCIIGERGLVHSGAVIGADGFGVANDGGRWEKIPQIGIVRIGNDVEIGANTTIDRGAMADTVIGNGVKLDNQIQIGHNVQVGDHTAMAGCVGVAGSAKIGAHCTVGGGAIILGHLSLADHVHVSAATLITKSIRQPGTYTGAYPFEPHEDWLRHAAQLKQYDKLSSRLKALEQQRQPGDNDA